MSKDLFEEIRANGWPRIKQLLTDNQQESVSLEFKTKRSSQTGSAERDDKKNHMKTVSAFCNSQGGLLIWGINAEKDNDGIDAAQNIVALEKAEVYEGVVKSLLGDLLTPVASGIEVEIVLSGEDKEGCVLVWVPASDRRPHREEIQHHYFKRSGDSSYRMEHFDLEDIFMARKSAVLDLTHRIEVKRPRAARTEFTVDVGLVNQSRVSARFPYLGVPGIGRFAVSEFSVAGGGPFPLPKLEGQAVGELVFSGGANTIIHPDQTLYVCRFDILYDDDLQEYGTKLYTTAQFTGSANPIFQREFFWGCDSSPKSSKTLEINLYNYI